MAGRRRAASTAFRPSAPAGAVRAPSRGQTTAMLVGVLAVAVAIAVASFAVKPNKARSFDLFYGSIYIDDNYAPVAIDLSSGKATVQLKGASSAVSAQHSEDLDVVPLQGGTLMLNAATGEFNMLDSSGFVIKPTGGGVRLAGGSGSGATTAVAAGDSAYLVRPGDHGTGIYLVGQSTVASAVGITGSAIKPRASATLKRTSEQSAAVMTGANGDLWLLAGAAGASRQLVRLSLPAGSNAGAALSVRRFAHISGHAALTSATVEADGTGGDAVGAAGPRNVRVYAPDGSEHTVPVQAPRGLTDIVPVHDGAGSLTFLYQGASAWSLVRVPVAGGAAVTHTVDGLSSESGVVTPVESSGKVYTIIRETAGRIVAIDADGTLSIVPGVTPTASIPGSYPIIAKERLSLTGAEVTARGNRVIFDSRTNYKAVVVFSDGSHDPRVVDKHSAVAVNTNGVASINSPDKQNSGEQKPQKQNKPQPHPEQAVNNKINCKIVSQTPHIPSVQLVQRAARSVQLQWTYPLLDPQDCDPSTYQVAIKTLTSGAPSPRPGSVVVQGQDGVNITGLFPDTEYQMVVTAYINKLHTSSAPINVTTSVEGPAAPTNVHTAVDDQGNWTVSWNSCGGIAQGCVPTADWQIVPHLCDGVGLSAAPDTRRRVGDPTQHTFSFTYTGSNALLGRGLSFDIEGIGTKGTVGDTAGDGQCSYSWAHPITSAISLHASAPPPTSSGSATSQTTVTASFGGDQSVDLGGVGGELTFKLLLNGRTVGSAGPTTKTSVTLPGIVPGRNYTASATVNPPRHRDAAASVGPVPVKAAVAKWPAPGVSASFSPSTNYLGTLAVTMSLPAGTDNHGETFDLTSPSRLQCGNTATPLAHTNISAGQQLLFGNIDRTQYNGQCSVVVVLAQDSATETNPPLYGDGTTSTSASTSIGIPVPSLTAGPSTFYANWNSSAPFGQPEAVVGYNGGDSQFLAHASGWSIKISNDGGTTPCGGSDTPLTNGDASQVIDVYKTCIRNGGTFTAAVSFAFYGTAHTYPLTISGSAPQPIQASKMNFSGHFNGGLLNPRPQLIIDYSGDYHDQSILSSVNWKYVVTSSASPSIPNCMKDGTQNTAPYVGGNGPGLDMNYERCPMQVVDSGTTTTAVYTLTISFDDPNYGVSYTYPPIDVGSP